MRNKFALHNECPSSLSVCLCDRMQSHVWEQRQRTLTPVNVKASPSNRPAQAHSWEQGLRAACCSLLGDLKQVSHGLNLRSCRRESLSTIPPNLQPHLVYPPADGSSAHRGQVLCAGDNATCPLGYRLWCTLGSWQCPLRGTGPQGQPTQGITV